MSGLTISLVDCTLYLILGTNSAPNPVSDSTVIVGGSSISLSQGFQITFPMPPQGVVSIRTYVHTPTEQILTLSSSSYDLPGLVIKISSTNP